MKKFLISLMLLCFPVSSYADEFPRPEDVATIDGMIKAYYDVVSGAKGEKRQKERDFSLHRPDAKVTTLSRDKDGNITISETKLEGYYKGAGPIIESNFFEYEIFRKEERLGNIAHVWSTYEVKTGERDGPVSRRGINSIQLFHDGKRWWITAEMWDNAVKADEIPAKYMPQKSVFNFSNLKTPEANIITGGMPNDDDLKALADRGVKTIVNFRPRSEHPDYDEEATVKALGMTYVNIPMDNAGEAPEKNAAILNKVLQENDGRIYLHCRSGKRAGSMLGLRKYLFEGYSADDAARYAGQAHKDVSAKEVKEIIEKMKK